MSKFIEQRFKAAIECYTEQKVLSCEFFQDPKVAGTWAARATVVGLDRPADFIIVSSQVPWRLAAPA